MTALTSLTEFSTLGAGSHQLVLPHNIKRLKLGYCWDASSVQAMTSLQQLQHLSLEVDFEECQPLLQLAQLSSLQHVALSYRTAKAAAVTAPAWPQLRQLLLLYSDEDLGPDLQQWAAISAAVAACTNLTSLVLDVTIWEEDWAGLHHYHLERIAVCAGVAGLPCLLDLYIYIHMQISTDTMPRLGAFRCTTADSAH
jgi:hypothetical protein